MIALDFEQNLIAWKLVSLDLKEVVAIDSLHRQSPLSRIHHYHRNNHPHHNWKSLSIKAVVKQLLIELTIDSFCFRVHLSLFTLPYILAQAA